MAKKLWRASVNRKTREFEHQDGVPDHFIDYWTNRSQEDVDRFNSSGHKWEIIQVEVEDDP